MPSLNLRLTDEQHRAIVDAAHRSGRSVQKQIVFMLFGGPPRADIPPVRAPQPAGGDRFAPGAPAPARERSFRGPDLKPSQRKKGK